MSFSERMGARSRRCSCADRSYDDEEATFIAVAEDGHTVGELLVDDTVGYGENTDAFVIPTAQ